MDYERRLAAFYDDLHAMRNDHPGIRSVVEAGDDRVYLDGICADPKGLGLGTAFMHGLTALLDRHRLVMELEPVAEEGAIETARLRAWYARFRFTAIGQNAMRRRPGPRNQKQ